jgi:hypothetical protein
MSSRRTKTYTEAERIERAAKKLHIKEYRAKTLQKVQESEASRRLARSQEVFVSRVRFGNRLPDPPLEQRFMRFPVDDDLMKAYDLITGVSSEAAAPRAFAPEPDLGVGLALGLLDPAAYGAVLGGTGGATPQLHPDDEAACSAEFAKPAGGGGARREGEVTDGKRIEWLMASQLLHTDLYDNVYKHGDAAENQQRALKRRIEALKPAVASSSAAARVEASFAAAAALDGAAVGALKHPANAKLIARRSWALLPEVELAGLRTLAVAFDAPPDDEGGGGAGGGGGGGGALSPVLKRARAARALLRARAPAPGEVQSRGTANMLYLLPDASQLGGGGGGVRADALREYAMTVDAAGMGVGGGKEVLLLRFDDAAGVVLYTPLSAQAACVRSRGGVGGGAPPAPAAATFFGAEGGEEAAAAAAAAAAATRAAAEAAAASALVLPRPFSEAEEEEFAVARARAEAADPRPVVEWAAGRKRLRERAAALARGAAEEAAAGAAGAAAAAYSGAAARAAAAGGGAPPAAVVAAVDDDLFDEA